MVAAYATRAARSCKKNTIYECYQRFKHVLKPEYEFLLLPNNNEYTTGKLICNGKDTMNYIRTVEVPSNTKSKIVFLDTYFQFMQNVNNISNYKLKQLYKFYLEDNEEEEYEDPHDTDYIPPRHSIKKEEYEEDDNDEQSDNEESEDDPDYVDEEEEEGDEEYDDDFSDISEVEVYESERRGKRRNTRRGCCW